MRTIGIVCERIRGSGTVPNSSHSSIEGVPKMSNRTLITSASRVDVQSSIVLAPGRPCRRAGCQIRLSATSFDMALTLRPYVSLIGRPSRVDTPNIGVLGRAFNLTYRSVPCTIAACHMSPNSLYRTLNCASMLERLPLSRPLVASRRSRENVTTCCFTWRKNKASGTGTKLR